MSASKKKVNKTKQVKAKKYTGSYTMYWNDQKPWFLEQCKKFGMHGSTLVKLAVEEYVQNHSEA